MNDIKKLVQMKTLILIELTLLIFILSIPGTIALRNILAGTLLIIFFFSWLKNDASIKIIDTMNGNILELRSKVESENVKI